MHVVDQVGERKPNTNVVAKMERKTRVQVNTGDTQPCLSNQTPASRSKGATHKEEDLDGKIEKDERHADFFRTAFFDSCVFKKRRHMPHGTDRPGTLPTALKVALKVKDERWNTQVFDTSLNLNPFLMEHMRPFVCTTRCVVCVTVDAAKKSVDVCLRQTEKFGHDAASEDVRFDQACARVFGRFDVDCVVPIVVTSVSPYCASLHLGEVPWNSFKFCKSCGAKWCQGECCS